LRLFHFQENHKSQKDGRHLPSSRWPQYIVIVEELANRFFRPQMGLNLPNGATKTWFLMWSALSVAGRASVTDDGAMQRQSG
jgi:hypothetical protein